MKKKNVSPKRKETSIWTKLFYGLLIAGAGITLYVLWPEIFPKEELEWSKTENITIPVQPVMPEPPAESFPARFVFKTDPECDTTVVFHLRYNDNPHDVEWRDKSNTVVIWRSTQGKPYQIISHSVQKKWKPLPAGGELVFNNGKVLTVKFVKEARPAGAPLDPNPDWLK